MVRRKDGKLLAALRSSKVNMHYALSEDAGKSREPVRSFGFKGHCPYFLRHSSGNLAVASAHTNPAGETHYPGRDHDLPETCGKRPLSLR